MNNLHLINNTLRATQTNKKIDHEFVALVLMVIWRFQGLQGSLRAPQNRPELSFVVVKPGNYYDYVCGALGC